MTGEPGTASQLPRADQIHASCGCDVLCREDFSHQPRAGCKLRAAAGNDGRVTSIRTGRPILELETHLLEAPDQDAAPHDLSADCWCEPEVQVIHRVLRGATMPSHQADDTRGEL